MNVKRILPDASLGEVYLLLLLFGTVVLATALARR